MPTKQETFDTVVRGILAQGQKSIDPVTDKCRYRHELSDETVLKCAAGMLIPDDQYRPEFEGFSLDDCSERSKEIRSFFAELGHDIFLMMDLQTVHDGSYGGYSTTFSSDFIRRAIGVAARHGLSLDVLNEHKTQFTQALCTQQTNE